VGREDGLGSLRPQQSVQRVPVSARRDRLLVAQLLLLRDH